MTYINIKYTTVETIDEFETYKEAKEMLTEYRLAGMNGYLSNRSTKQWRER